MIDSKGSFNSIGGFLPLEVNTARVVQQDVEPARAGLHALRQPADLGLGRQIGDEVFDRCPVRLVADQPRGLAATLSESAPRRSLVRRGVPARKPRPGRFRPSRR